MQNTTSEIESSVAIIIPRATEEELKQYNKQKEQLKIKALSDKDKQTHKKVKAISAVGQIRAGLCPTCNHCLIWGDLECNECFQKVTWY